MGTKRPLLQAVQAILLISGLALAACGPASTSSTPPSSQGGADYQLGAILPLTGPASSYSGGTLAGLQTYIDRVNQSGGVNGHKIRLTTLDDASSLPRALSDMVQLHTSQQVLAIAGEYSGNCSGLLDQATQFETPLVCISMPDNYLIPARPYLFLDGVGIPYYSKPMIQLALAVAKPKGTRVRMALFTTNTASQAGLRSGVAALATSQGFDLVANEIVATSATEFSVESADVASKRPDVILNALPSTAAVSGMVKSLVTAGVSVPVIGGSPGSASIPTLSSINSSDYYALSTFAYPVSGAPGKGVQDILTAARAAKIDPTQAFFTSGWSEGLITVQALRKCANPCTGSKFEAALETLKLDTQGFTPSAMSFTMTDHQPIHSMSAYQWDAVHGVPKLFKANLLTGDH